MDISQVIDGALVGTIVMLSIILFWEMYDGTTGKGPPGRPGI